MCHGPFCGRRSVRTQILDAFNISIHANKHPRKAVDASSTYFLPTTGFTRAQKVRPIRAHKLPGPTMLQRTQDLVLPKWPYPFQHPYPSHEKQPITISIASNCYGPAGLQAASDATFKFRPNHILAIIAFMHMYIYACSRTDCTVAVSTTPHMR